MTHVIINGQLYVPVSAASIDGAAIMRALVEQWWGDASEEEVETYSKKLRVVVSDNIDNDTGETLEELVARILEAAA